jgi:hypothetical protein
LHATSLHQAQNDNKPFETIICFGNLNHCKSIFHISYLAAARTSGARAARERDSSGTTEATDQREGAKVMERIARRERAEGARSGSPKLFYLFIYP